ncbi:MAG: flagellar motor protein MotB [Gemmobacter sp.]|nr:flagellar motor protein MotB [Gemmobacter sp.]
MAGPGNAAPVIIKRKKVISGGGHHGGAWKVAYADFVTAMMAFFLLMWLLNATTEKQRKGLADYFNPTVPISRISGGGEGAFGGDSVFSEDTMTKSGLGASNQRATESNAARGESGADAAAEAKLAQDLQQALRARGGESMTMERLLRHVVTKVTDEGLVVEVFDLDDSPLFVGDGGVPTPVLRELAQVVSEVFSLAVNEIAVQGHVKNYPITLIDNPAWDLSSERAQAMRVLVVETGLQPGRMQRIAGFADRKPVTSEPMAERNNRLEVILLRSRPQRSMLGGY